MSRTVELVKEFDKIIRRVRGIFVAHVGQPLAAMTSAAARAEVAEIALVHY
jgi:hypothetical protein